MEQANFKKHMWIGIGVIALSVIVFGVALYILSGTIASQANAITGSRADIQNQSALINSYSNLKGSASAAATYQAAMDKLLATQDNLISFPSQIDGIARSSGVDETFAFQGDPIPATPSALGYVSFKLNATGSLNNLTAFLKDAEMSAPVLLSKIDSFDLTQSGSNYALSAMGRVFFK